MNVFIEESSKGFKKKCIEEKRKEKKLKNKFSTKQNQENRDEQV